jgi:hypothetical protein
MSEHRGFKNVKENMAQCKSGGKTWDRASLRKETLKNRKEDFRSEILKNRKRKTFRGKVLKNCKEVRP